MEEADRLYDRILELDATDPEARACRSELRGRRERIRSLLSEITSNKDPKFQKERWERILALDPNGPSAYAQCGLCILQICGGSVDDALRYFREALARDPGEAVAHFGIAMVYVLARPHPERAQEHLRQVTKGRTPDWMKVVTLAEGLRRTGKAAEALPLFEGLDPATTNHFIEFERGMCLVAVRRFADALEAFATVLRLDFNQYAARLNRGSTYCNLGQFASAQDDAEAARRLDPSRAETWLLLGKVHIGLRQWSPARAATLNSLGRIPEAEAAYRKAVRHDTDGSGWSGLGTLFYQQKRDAEAEEALTEARVRGHWGALWNRGLARARLGDYFSAAADFAALAELEADAARRERAQTNARLLNSSLPSVGDPWGASESAPGFAGV